MVGVLSEDGPATGPGRDDVEGQTEARPTGDVSLVDPGSAATRRQCRRGGVEGERGRPSRRSRPGDDENGLVVLGGAGDGIDDLLLQPGAVARGVLRVLGQLGGTDDVGDLRESSIRRLLVEGVNGEALVPSLVQARGLVGLLELLEPCKGLSSKLSASWYTCQLTPVSS